MAPVRKPKANKSGKPKKEKQEKMPNIQESVVSGQLQKKINKKQQRPKRDPKGVVFIKHLPHGFFEGELQKYFEQFGNVTRVRLARSKRTGNSKGYAFVEFEYPEVAEVAAETMNNYLMFKQIVKATYIPPEKQLFNYFRTSVKKIRNKSGKLVWVSAKTAALQQKMKKHNDWSEDNYKKRTQKQLEKLKKLEKKYAHLDININASILQPKFLTDKEKKFAEKSVAKQQKQEKIGCKSEVSKRKFNKEEISSKENKNTKKLKNKPSTRDLKGSTIQEDSDEEDFIAVADSDDNANESEKSSDEETYGFSKMSDVESDENCARENLEKTSRIIKKQSKKFGKNLKSNAERFDEILKRKPHVGGINKLSKKQPAVVNKGKKKLQITAAKELAKPLSKCKTKLSKSSKSKKM